MSKGTMRAFTLSKGCSHKSTDIYAGIDPSGHGKVVKTKKVKTDAANKSLVYSCDLTVTNKTQKPKGIIKVLV